MNKIYELILNLAKFLDRDGRKATTGQVSQTVGTITNNPYYKLKGGAGMAKVIREAANEAIKNGRSKDADTIKQVFTNKNGGPLKFKK